MTSYPIMMTLPAPTPSQNTYQRSHWGRRHKLVDMYRKQLRARLDDLGMFSHRRPDVRLRVTFTRYSTGHLDRGNLIGGMKPLLDAMKHEGLIFDDTEQWLDDAYEQRKCKRAESRTAITIELADSARAAHNTRTEPAQLPMTMPPQREVEF